MKVVIIDTKCANTNSVKFAIERLGHSPVISSDPLVIERADKVFLPGVGSAKAAMQSLHDQDLVTCITGLKQPVLGICLGMQLLALYSQESFAKTNLACLGICDGGVHLMAPGALPLPHMGWNRVYFDCQDPLFQGIEDGAYFYFVHSYAFEIGGFTVAQCTYGTPFSAAIRCDNFYGVQFHPERSAKVGLRLIENFLNI